MYVINLNLNLIFSLNTLKEITPIYIKSENDEE